MFPQVLVSQAASLIKAAERKGIMIATAESCTGGLVAALLTQVPGSSAVVERGFVTYSNAAKAQMLGVPASLIRTHGAVSAPVAKAMAQGALKHSKAQLAVAVTGIAGPGGGTVHKPVGLVFIAVATQTGAANVVECHFKGTRAAIRLLAVKKAIGLLTVRLSHSS